MIAWDVILREGLEDLREDPRRAVISALGVICSAAGMVLLLAAGVGFRAQLLEQLREYGREGLQLTAGLTSSGFPGYPVEHPVRFSRSAAAAAERGNPAVEAVLPVHGRDEFFLVSGSGLQRWYHVDGVDPRYLAYRNFRLIAGHAFGAEAVERGSPEVVLGHDVALELFGGAGQAVGQRIRIDGLPFVVVGVSARKQRQYVNLGRPDNRALLVPIHAAERWLGFDRDDVRQLVVYPAPGHTAAQALHAVLRVLGPELRFHPDDVDAIFWYDTGQLAHIVDLVSKALLFFVGLSSSVTLLVAGVGIASFQLAVFARRVREIAVAKALGATNRMLVLQTAAESVLLTASAAALGTGLGVAVVRILAAFAEPRALPAPRAPAALLAFVGCMVALVAGSTAAIPALRVRRMDPCTALRSAS